MSAPCPADAEATKRYHTSYELSENDNPALSQSTTYPKRGE